MTTPEAAGQRFLGTGPFIWMADIAKALKTALGEQAGQVATRQLPNVVVRIASIFNPSLKAITISLGRRNRHTTEKARRILGWTPRPAEQTAVECARSLIEHGINEQKARLA
ncbi:hypothetical protein GCM10027613_32210 [Microlunatus endophyticus]